MKTSEMMKAGFVLNFICIGTTGVAILRLVSSKKIKHF